MQNKWIASIATWCVMCTHAVPGSAADTETQGVAKHIVVVRPSDWSDSLTLWKRHRQAQGFQIDEVDAEIGRSAIQKKIRANFADQTQPTGFILLCGDVGQDPKTTIPPFYKTSTALVQFGGDATIATDNPYADLDADDIPDLALGRIPADTPEQLAASLDRVIAYETRRASSLWRRNVHVIAGVGGFGPVADSVIEMTTRKFLGDRIPGWAHVSMTQASLSSHYCPNPFRFSHTTVARMNEGGMFWVYIGHGHVKTLDYMKVEKQFLPIMNVENLPEVDSGTKPPIAVFLACYTGAFDAMEDSLAERLVLSDTGPIAAIAASRVSGPYGLAMLSNGLLDGCYVHNRSTLGETLLRAKQATLAEESLATTRSKHLEMIGSIAKALSPADYDLRAERQEHVWQMHLLGDPSLHLNHPRTMNLEVAEKSAPGEMLQVQSNVQMGGKLLVELCHRRTARRRELGDLPVDWHTEDGKAAFQTRYQRANNTTIVSSVQIVEAGPFQVELQIPVDLRGGRYCVRTLLESENGWEVGYQEVAIRKPRK